MIWEAETVLREGTKPTVKTKGLSGNTFQMQPMTFTLLIKG